MRILAIDHGQTSGFAFIDEDGKLKSRGLFYVKGDTVGEKLIDFHTTISGLVETYEPTHLAIETPSHDRNGKTRLILTGYYCQLLITASFNNIETFPVHPTSLKKEITGYGKSDKEDVAGAISKIYNIPVEEIVKYDRYKTGKYKGDIRPKTAMYDISDAIALATFVYRRLNK